MGFSKSRKVHFAMDTTTGNLSKDLAIMDNIQSKLNNAGITVERHDSTGVTKGRGPSAMYNNMKYLYDNNIHDEIMLHLCNGVDPANIREVATNGNDNRGRTVRSRGNDVIMAWFYGACDCVHPGGSCYDSVRDSETHTGRLYNPMQYMEQNNIKAICESDDYTGDKIAEDVIALFDDTTTTTSSTIETNENGKTLREQTVEKIYTKAYYKELFTVKTDENGSFQVPVKLPYVGDYVVNYNFAGDRDHSPSTRTTHIDNQTGEIFQRQLLMTRTTKNYGTNEDAEVTEVGSIAGYEHTVTEKTITKYDTSGTTTTTTSQDSDTQIIVPSKPPTENVETISNTRKDPFQEVVGITSDGKPQVDKLQTGESTYEFVDLTKTYTLTREQYTTVFKRDSQTMQLKNYKMSAYVAFQCEEYPNKYIVLERERWNMIEESYYAFMVQGAGLKNSYAVVPYPQKLTVNFKEKTTTFDGNNTRNWKAEKGNIYYVADNQNYGRTCGPTSSSVCTQVLHNYYSERNLEEIIHAQANDGSSPSGIASALKNSGFYATTYTGTDTAISWLKEGKPVVFHVHDHYIALCDIYSDGSVLVLNSTTSSSYGPSTGWVTQQTLRNKYYGAGVKIGLNWSISNDEKLRLQNFFENMGGEWKKQENKSEKVTYYQLKYK